MLAKAVYFLIIGMKTRYVSSGVLVGVGVALGVVVGVNVCVAVGVTLDVRVLVGVGVGVNVFVGVAVGVPGTQSQKSAALVKPDETSTANVSEDVDT